MATRLIPPQDRTYYINPDYLTFVENSGYGANLIQVSASSSCYISVYVPGIIGYSDADRNYQRWKVTAYNNKFPDDKPEHRGKWYIYVRLEQKGTSALIIYDQVLRGVKGGEITVSKDENGNDVYTEAETTQTDYWFIRIGEVGPTDGTSIRSITYDTGLLRSDEVQNDKDGINDMWELDKYSTPWLIRAKHWLSSFTVKGFIKLIGSLIFQNSEGVEKPIVDIKRSTDKDVPVDDTTIPTTAYVRSISDDRYLKKYEEDETNYRIRFYDGIEAGHFVKGMIGGAGTQFDGQGYGEMNGLTLREFLEVPELRFNRIDVVSGELWNSIAFGLVEKVDTDKRICWIKLEERERCGLHVYDICRGIFADFGDGTQWEGEDECGFLHLYGFWTAYFTPTKILENSEGVFSFQYELKAGTTQHPVPSMKFAVYGNFVDASRQASAYSTRTYKRYLNKVDTWVIDPDKHIYAQYGDLEGLTIGSVHMHGYGSFQSNAYFKGTQIQLTPSQLESLKGESAYTAILSDYEGVVTIDDEGNIIGGEQELLNVITDGENVITSGQNVVTAGYRLKTEVQAMRGNTQLFYSPSSVVQDSYVINIASVGCTAMVLNGVVVVTSVTNPERCYVNVLVNCEGKASFTLTYYITAIRDGKNPIVADIDNEMDAVACDSSGKVIFGLPVSCTVSMWAGVKKLPLDRLVMETPAGVTASANKDTGVVTVTAIADEAERTLPINLTAYATHGGIQYHKELVFTVNKVNAGENALLYKLSPSVSSVKVDDEGVMTATSVTCEVVASNGSHIETLTSLPKEVTMEFFRDKETPAPYSYRAPISISGGNKTVTFRLYSNGALIDVETIPILIDGRSPVVLDLDNEMHSVACDEDGKVVVLPEISTGVQMYWGSRKLDTKIVELIKPDGLTASFSGTTVSVTAVSDSAADTLRLGITAEAKYGDTTYTRTAYMVINKIRQGNSALVLDLTPSVSAIKIDKRGAYIPEKIFCRTKMTNGKKEVSEPAALQDNYTMRYSVDGKTEVSYSYGSNVDVVSIAPKESVQFRIYYSKDNGKTDAWKQVDRETVPVLADAADAFKSTVFIRSNSTPDRPKGGSYENPKPDGGLWSDGVPAGEAILWVSVRTFTSDGKDPQDEEWSAPAQMTDTASFEVIYHESESRPTAPTNKPTEGSWTPNNGWMDDATENSIWMATAIKINGEWGAWQISKIKGEKGDKLTFEDLTEEDKEELKGEDASTYTVLPNLTAIGQTMTGTLSPETVTFTCYRDTGTSEREKETAKWYAYRTNNYEDFENVGSMTPFKSQTSYSSTFSVTFTRAYKYYRIEAYPYNSRPIVLEPFIVADGQDGEQGPVGAMPRYCGIFKAGTKYVYNDEYRDIVVHNGEVFQVYEYGSSITNTPPNELADGAVKDGWEKANKYSFVAMDTALIEGASIAGFNFKSSKMVSQFGHLVLDGIYGTLECNDVDLEGKIVATEGSFTGAVYAEEGIIGGFSIGEEYLQSGNSLSSGIMTLSSTVLGFRQTNGLHVMIGPDAFPNSSGIECGLYSEAPAGDFSIWAIGGNKLVSPYNPTSNNTQSNDLTLIGGLALTCKSGTTFKSPSNQPSGMTKDAWVDFLNMSGSASLPNPNTCPGKVVFVRCKSGSTLSVPNGKDAEGGDKTSWSSDNIMRLFISDGSNWHEMSGKS